jgi:DUF4097 and DUF4098 domain-containing protein YvlB
MTNRPNGDTQPGPRKFGLKHDGLAFALTAAAGLAVAIFVVVAQAETRKESKINIAPAGAVNIITGGGSVTLHSGPGQQLLVSYAVHSEKVEVDQNVSANNQRVELRTHALSGSKPSAEDSKVDYDLTVPAGIAINVSTTAAPITADSLSGEIDLSSETGQITVRNMAKSHVRVRSMTGHVSLNNVTLSRVDIQSTSGNVQLNNVSGSRVAAGTGSGAIDYRGDCSGGGDYILTTHSGNIDMILPATASVDLTARSTNGSVENADFPLREKAHNSFTPTQGRSFAGTSNSGASSVELQSFSGKIRVKKQ